MIKFLQRLGTMALLLSIAVVPNLLYHFIPKAAASVLGWDITDYTLLSYTHDENVLDKDLIQIRVDWTKPANGRGYIKAIADGKINGVPGYGASVTSGILPLDDTSGQTTLTIDTHLNGPQTHSCDGYDITVKLVEAPGDGTTTVHSTTTEVINFHPSSNACGWDVGPHPTAYSGNGGVVNHYTPPDDDSVGIRVVGKKNIGDYTRLKIFVNGTLKETIPIEEQYESFDFTKLYTSFVGAAHSGSGYTIVGELYRVTRGTGQAYSTSRSEWSNEEYIMPYTVSLAHP